MVKTKDIVENYVAKAYLTSPESMRKYIKPVAKQVLKVERNASKASKKGNVIIKKYVTAKTKEILGFANPFSSLMGGKKKKRR
jgi:hypothetical protein